MQFYIGLVFSITIIVSNELTLAQSNCFSSLQLPFSNEQTQKSSTGISFELEQKARRQKEKYSSDKLPRAKYFIYQSNIINEIMTVAATISTRFPDNKYFVVGIGGSPSPIIAALQSSYADYAANLPLSIPTLTHLVNKPVRHLPPETEADLHQHFSKFLPRPEVLGNRSIIMLDFTITGDSLIIATDALKKKSYHKQSNSRNHSSCTQRFICY